MCHEAIDHLTRVIGLCQTPREQWNSEDQRLFREAREYVQQHMKEKKLESERERTGPEAFREPGIEPNGVGAVEEVPKDPDAIEHAPKRRSFST